MSRYLCINQISKAMAEDVQMINHTITTPNGEPTAIVTQQTVTQLIPKEKKKVGGWRPNSGRKRRMDEEEIIRKLAPMETKAFGKLAELIERGDVKALELYLKYYLGIPTQRIESKIEGNLSAISVHVVRPMVTETPSNDGGEL